MKAVELTDLSRSYGKRWALRSVSLDINQGDKVLLTGPNGAGKTTLLQIVGTRLAPSSGTCKLFGETLEDNLKSLRRKLGVLFMESFLYGELSVEENLLFYAKLYDLDSPTKSVREWLARVQMQDFANARVATLSRGERQRVSLARSLLHNPQLLLWDEPTTGLDTEARGFLRSVMEDRPDSTLICVTHDPDFFTHWMTRSIKLAHGSLET